ncbi:5' nucleotidase, NT5C type [Cohnella boryungensis]|uniref:Nucleotidase n=1 Tax=Cohnella boryungensis TaxID=768479 RepID=A0ABV8SIH4_9BACL
MKLGFDIDDTLLNLREQAFRIYNAKLNRQVDIEAFHALTCISVHEPFGLTSEEGRAMWDRHRDEIYDTAAPFANAVEVLRELDRRGHEVYYITARTAQYCERTRRSIAEIGFPVREGRFFCGMGDLEKVHIIKKLGLDYYFDDKPKVLDTLGELELAVYVKDNSYNRELNMPRIVDWNELLQLVDEDERM